MDVEVEPANGESNGEILGPCLTSHIDEGSAESHRYYLSRRTVLEMLRDRGYSVPASEIDLSLQDFRFLHGPTPDIERLRFSATHCTDPSDRMLVIYCGPGIVKVNVIRGLHSQIANKDTLTGLILITQNQITDLLVNITKHVLKPKHRVLTDKEKGKLLKKYNIEEKQLPRLSRKDAISRYYGLEKGQVLKVTYTGDITESHVTYRCIW
ncbi:DNA-directed RNA polymerase V subunit 5A-like isoform X2 [Pyrus communis]|uniref:DNA-directed RNA polymerase V subunit 5A-like isoform X2 n=1 Tax=Pyrus communis TaxID=23211 RepID=UPI0035C24082